MLPFTLPGRFWRGNLHCHSNRSDGALAPEEVCRRYREAGYDFVAVTDHFRPEYGFPLTDTRAIRTDDFTTLLGAELEAPRTEFASRWHIVAVGLPVRFVPPEPSESGPEIHGIEIAGGRIGIRCSPVHKIVVTGSVPGAQWRMGDGLTECRLPLNMFARSPYVRVTVTDVAGNRAWSNPIRRQ